MTNIEWTDKSWNPVIGCSPVSPGCLNCYAATMAYRLQNNPKVPDYQPRPCATCAGQGACELEGVDHECYGCRQTGSIRIAEVRNGRPVFTGDVRCLPDRLTEPLSWRTPSMVFVNSMSDLFHEDVPFEFIDQVFAVMALCPRHTFQVLTKRPERMAEYLTAMDLYRIGRAAMASEHWRGSHKGWSMVDHPDGRLWIPPWPLQNVWLGTSCEDQKRADERIPHLLRCPAAVRFLSCEPLLGPIDLGLSRPALTDLMDATGRDERHKGTYPFSGVDADKITRRHHALHWVIVGGESGAGARPCNIAWIRAIVEQCRDAGVACFVKQLRACVIDRNDAGFDADELHQQNADGSWSAANPRAWSSSVCVDVDWDRDATEYQGKPVRILLDNKKGGDPAEWPDDLRVRQMPGEAAP